MTGQKGGGVSAIAIKFSLSIKFKDQIQYCEFIFIVFCCLPNKNKGKNSTKGKFKSNNTVKPF